MYRLLACFLLSAVIQSIPAHSLVRPDREFKVFQFPANMIPRIDGDTSDWSMVPDDYAIGADELLDTVNANPVDTRNFDVRVKVGWVKGLDRLYVLYEAYDDCWNFDLPGLGGDMFEVVRTATFGRDAHSGSGTNSQGWLGGPQLPGVQAQIFTSSTSGWETVVHPIVCQPWIADFPWSTQLIPITSNRAKADAGARIMDHAVRLCAATTRSGGCFQAEGRHHHRVVMVHSRKRYQGRSEEKIRVLVAVPCHHHVRQRLGTRGVPAHAH